MKTLPALLGAAALLLCSGLHAQTGNTDAAKSSSAQKLDRHTEKFFKEAAMGGMAEVELGKVAAQKASSAEVKNFGEMMVKDHTGANEKLKALAKAHNVALPTELDKAHQSAKEKLSKKQGVDFDKDYMDQMVRDHKKTIDLFEDTAKKSEVAEVKAFAQSTLPVLKQHLQLAEQLEDKVDEKK
jgi:putative membrane protein